MDAQVLSHEQQKLVDAGQLARAEELLASWLAAHAGEDTSVPRLELARVLFWRGRLRGARELLERLWSERPGDTWVASFLAQVEIRMGDQDRARELLERAVALEPHNHEARLFLGGNVVDDAARARRMLADGLTSTRRRIELAALCSAIDFRSGRCAAVGLGPLTQPFLDRAHLMLDGAEPGEDVEVPASMRAAFLHADRVVYYLAHPLAEAVLGLAALSALLRFFALRPEARRPVELVTPHAELLSAAARDPLVKVTAPGDGEEAALAAEDLRRRRERVLAMSSGPPEVARALAVAGRDRPNALAILDLHLDRHARGFFPWRSTHPPHRHVLSYPARLYRLMEMALGIKLAENPATVQVSLALPDAAAARRAEVLERHGLAGGPYHVAAGACGEALLQQMASDCARREAATGERWRIAVAGDELPEDPGGRLRRLRAHGLELVAALSGARTVVSADPGTAMLAAALGRPTLALHTETDPFLWSTGGPALRALWSDRAFAAHLNQVPVDPPRAALDALPDEAELLDAWRRCEALGEANPDGAGAPA